MRKSNCVSATLSAAWHKAAKLYLLFSLPNCFSFYFLRLVFICTQWINCDSKKLRSQLGFSIFQGFWASEQLAFAMLG